MHEIEPKLLWLGHALDCRDPKRLFEWEIEAVVDVAYEEPPASLPRQLIYCRFPLNDGGGNAPSLLRLTIETVVSLLAFGTPAVVTCSAGMSRSPTIAAAALAIHRDEPLEEAVQRIGAVKSLEVSGPLWSDIAAVLPQIRRP